MYAYTQNLIPNYSFEDTTTRVTPLFLPADWEAATLEGWNYYTPLQNQTYPYWGSPNNVNGYQQAKTGSAYQASLSFGTSHLIKKANTSSKKKIEISYPQEEFLIKKHY